MHVSLAITRVKYALALVFNGVSFNLPINRVGVITFDEDYQPLFELRENSPEVIASLHQAIVAIDDSESTPSVPKGAK
jgi:hypothetical protein